jgi:hypothetical protein
LMMITRMLMNMMDDNYDNNGACMQLIIASTL